MNKDSALESYRKLIQHNLDSLLELKYDRSTLVKPSSNVNQRDSIDLPPQKVLHHVAETHTTQGDIEIPTIIEAPVKKRKQLSRESKRFLETAFEAKRDPNSKERHLIAEKSGLTPMQVRVWFTNKRMRSK